MPLLLSVLPAAAHVAPGVLGVRLSAPAHYVRSPSPTMRLDSNAKMRQHTRALFWTESHYDAAEGRWIGRVRTAEADELDKP